MFDIHAALRAAVEKGGSDLHLKVPAPPIIRVDGELHPIEGASPLDPEDTEAALVAMLPDQAKLDEFRSDREIDFAYSISGLARFRVNAFRQRGSVSVVCRAIPLAAFDFEQLGLPPVVKDLAEEKRGIILVTGTTGSGKSTTLAAMIDYINDRYSRHIVTIEDPIEFLHPDKRSIINQREVGHDAASFKTALRRVLRQDPDVILIGEMRDEETVQTALSAAETGHLVFSTLHTINAPETVNRIIEFFPPHQHEQIRLILSGTLKGIVSQRLIPGAEGGRVVACEILRSTARVRDLLAEPEGIAALPEVIADGAYYGMQTFEQALFKAVKDGRVTHEAALDAASSPHELKLLFAADGRRGTSMDDVPSARAAAGAAGSPS